MTSKRGFLPDAGSLISYAIVVAGIATTIVLVLRNQPFSDPIFAHVVRVFLAVAAGVAVRVIPGALRISLSESGRQLTTTGALAFSVLTYFTAPALSESLDPEAIPVRPPPIIPMRTWGTGDFSQLGSYEFGEPTAYKTAWVSWSIRSAMRNSGAPILRQPINGQPAAATNPQPIATARFFLAESYPFERAYESFSAKIIAPPEGQRPHEWHQFLAFRVRPFKSSYTFQPIPVFKEASANHVIQVPEVRRGDLILLFADLYFRDSARSSTSGKSIAIHLVTY